MARVRPHVKIHISVADHRKTALVWSDLAKRGMLVELWRKAGEKFAGRTGDRVSLRPTDRMDIAATTDQAEADRALTGLCSDMKYEVRRYPTRWEVRIRKFSKKQGFEDKELKTLPAEVRQDLSPPNPSPNPKPNPIPSPKSEVRKPNPPAEARSPAAEPPPGPRSAGPRTLVSSRVPDPEGSEAVAGPSAVPGSEAEPLVPKPAGFDVHSLKRLHAWGVAKGLSSNELNAALRRFQEWVPKSSPERLIEDWEAAFQTIATEGPGGIARAEKVRRYTRDDSGQVLVPNEWRGYGS